MGENGQEKVIGGQIYQTLKKAGTAMAKKIKIRKVSAWTMGLTVVLAVMFAVVSYKSVKEFRTLRMATEQYIVCEKAAKQLQNGSTYLTAQVRMYAITRERKYMDLYFEEVNSHHRENAVESLQQYFDGTEMFDSLEEAMEYSSELMNTEYYAMRLVSEALSVPEETWPEEIKNVQLSEEDTHLGRDGKLIRAGNMVCDDEYEDMRTRITTDVSSCMDGLTSQTRDRQGRATAVFSDMYLKLEIGIVIMLVLMVFICLMLRFLIVRPLVSYNESIKKGEIFPVIGAAELQNLANTYNRVYLENQETQKLIRHQAEHDALTEALNRGSYEKLLHIYETGDAPFALILVDVDIFKSVNDTYGHAVGDAILQKVTGSLKKAFRSIDYVCRIGGDEFAVIMVDMTSDLKYTIEDKIKYVGEELAKTEGDVPAVTLSVGVAFSDRENPGDSIFKDADKALYHVKENGRNGCAFYNGASSLENVLEDNKGEEPKENLKEDLEK